MTTDYAYGEASWRISEFKRRVLGSEQIILHTADIVRQRGAYRKLVDLDIRHAFFQELNTLMESLAFRVVACAIDKNKHVERYKHAAIDPYKLSLHILVERFVMDLNECNGVGQIIAECRRPELDEALQTEFARLQHKGTYYMSARKIRDRIPSLVCRPKNQNVAGLQLADLVVTPVGRLILGKPVRDDMRIVARKFRRSPSGYMGAGLIVLPK